MYGVIVQQTVFIGIVSINVHGHSLHEGEELCTLWIKGVNSKDQYAVARECRHHSETDVN